MRREENEDAIVFVHPFEQEPTSTAIQKLREQLDDCDPRRLKRMRRQYEEKLREQPH